MVSPQETNNVGNDHSSVPLSQTPPIQLIVCRSSSAVSSPIFIQSGTRGGILLVNPSSKASSSSRLSTTLSAVSVRMSV